MGKLNGRDICVVSMTGAKMVKHPGVDVHVKGETLELRARLASAEEKAKVWPVCVEHYPDYALYQARTERDIPVFICEPRP
jgi:deazaflavin-dependent oxidoreductase (nitroreductase family)